MNEATIEITTGVYDISNEDYHAHAAISRSKLLALRKTPYNYWYENLSGLHVPDDNKSAFVFGSAFHAYILEPEKFDFEYVVLPNIDRRTKEGKNVYKAILEKSEGLTLLSEEDFELLRNMRFSLQRNELALNIIDGAKIEQSLFWTDEETGLQCKIRPDIWNDSIVADLKSSKEIDLRSFERSIYQYGYHIQAAMIREGFRAALNQEINAFAFIACEKTAPYENVVYLLDESAIERGFNDFKTLLRRLAECQHKNEWPSYETKTIKLPAYTNFEEL